MPDISKIILPEVNTTYDILSKQTRGIVRATKEATSTATNFVLTASGITELYDGLLIMFRNDATASASGVVINLNGLGGKEIWGSDQNARVSSSLKANSEYLIYYDSTNDRFVKYEETCTANSNTIGEYAGSCVASGVGMPRYSLIMQTSNSGNSVTWEGVVTASSTSTSKAKNTNGFILGSPVLYQSAGTYASGETAGQSAVWQTGYNVDTRYSCNVSSSWSLAGRPFFLKGTINQTDGKFYLADTTWWSDAYPTTNDGYYYIYVGQMSDKYRLSLYAVHPIFYFDTALRTLLVGNVANAQTVNGHTVNADVPSGAVFTDSKVTQYNTTTDADLRILLSNSATSTSETDTVYKSLGLRFNPDSSDFSVEYRGHQIFAVYGDSNYIDCYGDINIYDGYRLHIHDGDIYIENGNITVDNGDISTVTLNGASVGSDPKFTDTIGQIYYCETDSTSTTSAFVVNVTGITALTDGLTICVKNTVGVSASGCTLNLNGLGAKTIWLSLDNAACTNEWKSNSIYIFVYDATNQRWIMNMGRDTDVTGNNIVARYSRLPSGGNNVKKYSLFAMLPSGVYSSFTTNSGTGSKTFDSTNYFDIRKIYAYAASTDRSTGDLLSPSGWKLQGYDIDMRYSFNGVTTKASTSSLTQDLPVYLVFDPSAESGGCYKLKSPYYTQTPTSTGRIYVLVGVMRDSYRLDFWLYNPAFTYDGTKLVPFANSTLSGLVDTSITNPSAGDILTYDGFDWCNTNTIALKDSNGHTTVLLDGSTGTITSENTPSTGGFTVNDVVIGGFTTGSGNYFKFSLPFANTATSASITSIDQTSAGTKVMLPNTVLQTNFIDLANSTVSSVTKDWITFEFKLNSTQSANTPGTIVLANLTFELF